MLEEDSRGRKEWVPALSSDPWYILMPVQIVCNAKIFLSRDLALRVTLPENLEGLRPSFVVCLKESSKLGTAEPRSSGDNNSEKSNPLKCRTQTRQRRPGSEKTGTAVRDSQR